MHAYKMLGFESRPGPSWNQCVIRGCRTSLLRKCLKCETRWRNLTALWCKDRGLSFQPFTPNNVLFKINQYDHFMGFQFFRLFDNSAKSPECYTRTLDLTAFWCKDRGLSFELNAQNNVLFKMRSLDFTFNQFKFFRLCEIFLSVHWFELCSFTRTCDLTAPWCKDRRLSFEPYTQNNVLFKIRSLDFTFNKFKFFRLF